ncbi:hypothetical protein [Streptomyces sp. ADMS]|uniref:hypothetical protein n=1 Tax=Streptomyces sp. ADMS TaxID=3071415 RepID=UPI00399102EA
MRQPCSATTLAPSAHAASGGTSEAASAKDAAAPGPETLGDPVFPSLGNDGYRVSAYYLDLAYDATSKLVDGTATLRRTRYRNLATTRLGHVFAATALNLIRIGRWLTGTPLGGTRTSRLEALMLAA